MTRLALAAMLAAILLTAPAPVSAAPPPSPAPSPAPSPVSDCPASDTSSLCQQKRALDQVKQRLAANLAAAQGAQRQVAASLADNQQQDGALRGRLAQADQKLLALAAEMGRVQSELEQTEAAIRRQQARVRLLARAIYFQPASLWLLIASATSARDLLTTTPDLAAAASGAAGLERRLSAHRTELQTSLTRARAARTEQLDARTRLVADLARLADLRQQQENAGADLAVKIVQTRAEISKVDGQSAALAALIAQRLQEEQERIIADAMQQAWAQALLWIAANPGVPGVSAGHSVRYRFIWPEPQAQISQGFGPTDLAFEPPYQGYPHFHTGIDLVEPEGSPVLAADDGVVAAVGSGETGYGRYVVLSHRDGLLTLYGHLDQALVKVGDQVVQGRPVGTEGSTGNSTGPHLHFEFRSGGQPQDPSPLLPPGAPSPQRT